ncbi:MAG: hypothetical protein JWP27_1414 [Flaviaesturariibacter sp.]|nr:hypothetical protein [Flaviaesturariibacter sp.]
MHKRSSCLVGIGLFLSVLVGDAQRVPDSNMRSQDARIDTVAPDEDVEVSPPDMETDSTHTFDGTAVTPDMKTPVSTRPIDGRTVTTMKRDPDFWYVDKDRKKEEEKPKGPSFLARLFASRWFGYVMWTIVIGGFIALVLWFLASSDVSLFRRRSARSPEADSPEEETIFGIAYERELEAAIASENLPLAVRLMYLHMLKELSDRSLIQYKQERTNSAYLAELHGTAFYPDFFRLTRHFEYAWYGRFPVSTKAFESIRADYNHLKNRLS